MKSLCPSDEKPRLLENIFSENNGCNDRNRKLKSFFSGNKFIVRIDEGEDAPGSVPYWCVRDLFENNKLDWIRSWMNHSIGNWVFYCAVAREHSTHKMRWHLHQMYLLIFIGIVTTDMMAATESLAPPNTLFNDFGGELQCMARMPISELLRIKKTIQLISNVTVDETHTENDALSARSESIDRNILRDRFNNGFAAASMGSILTPMPYIGGHFRWHSIELH